MDLQTANINQLWLNNIYENIKKMEEHERLAREGCSSLIEYISGPAKIREVLIGQVQIKNIKFFITEFNLLLSDLTPILKEGPDEYRNSLREIEKIIEEKRDIFIIEKKNIEGKIVSFELKKPFYDVLYALSDLKVKLFKEIKHILYIETETLW